MRNHARPGTANPQSGLAPALGLRAGGVPFKRSQTNSVQEDRVMTLLSLWRAMGAPTGRAALVRSCRPVPRRIRTLKPSLESLEDRTVPSTLFVTKTLDDVTVPGTLRYAVANAKSGDTILLKSNDLTAPIVLTTGTELLLNKDLTIRPTGSGLVTVSGGGTSRVFFVATMTHVSLAGLLITGGSANFNLGGGILNNGTLTVSSCSLTGDSALDGGGIFNDGTLTVSNSTLSGDAAPLGRRRHRQHRYADG
jgi:hypothetical protein